MVEKPSFSSSPANPFSEAFPHSRKVLVEGERVAVPMREIALSGGESPLDYRRCVILGFSAAVR